MKKLLIVFLFFGFTGCNQFGYSISQKTVPFTDGYNVHTYIWKDGEIVWSHFTFQEPRLKIPIDSVPQVKARDYATAKRILKILKENNFKQ